VDYDKDRVPEGYEVQTDMFGFPFLVRKVDDRTPGWLKAVLAVVVLLACIKFTVPALDLLYRILF